jgi:hypothetical protein
LIVAFGTVTAITLHSEALPALAVSSFTITLEVLGTFCTQIMYRDHNTVTDINAIIDVTYEYFCRVGYSLHHRFPQQD